MTVKQAQHLLGYLGYYNGLVDGVAGPATKSATAMFQKDYGLEQDGVIGPATKEMLLEAVYGNVAKRVTVTQSGTESTSKTGTFWDNIRYFTREEFKCKCGGRFCNGYPAEMQEEVVRIADAARDHFGKPGHVISGLRCSQWNAHEGGVGNSQHMFGEAIDLQIDGVDSETLRQFVSTQPNHRYSYRINSTNVHFDIPAKNR